MRLKNRFYLFRNYLIKRSAAYLVDYVIVLVISDLISLYILGSLVRFEGPNFIISLEFWPTATKVQYILTYVSYFILCFYLYRGQTIGLKIFSLQVKQRGFNQREVTFISCLNRSMANYISQELYFIPFLLCLINLENKSFGDFVSSSQVMFYSSFENIMESEKVPVKKVGFKIAA